MPSASCTSGGADDYSHASLSTGCRWTHRTSAFSARVPLPGLKERSLVLRSLEPARRSAAITVMQSKKEDKGFFGNMMDKALLKLIETKEKAGAKKELQVRMTPTPCPQRPQR